MLSSALYRAFFVQKIICIDLREQGWMAYTYDKTDRGEARMRKRKMILPAVILMTAMLAAGCGTSGTPKAVETTAQEGQRDPQRDLQRHQIRKPVRERQRQMMILRWCWLTPRIWGI